MKLKAYIKVSIFPDEGEVAIAHALMHEIHKALRHGEYNPAAVMELVTSAKHTIEISPIPANILPPLTPAELANN